MKLKFWECITPVSKTKVNFTSSQRQTLFVMQNSQIFADSSFANSCLFFVSLHLEKSFILIKTFSL